MHELTVRRDGTIVACEPEAIEGNLAAFVDADSWKALGSAIRQCLDSNRSRWLCVRSRNGDSLQMTLRCTSDTTVRIRASFQSHIPTAILAALGDDERAESFRVLLIDLESEYETRVEFESREKVEAVGYVDEWLNEPLDLIPAVVPPRS